jgi:diguanylate cyclase (GGDEF)-like protein/PAS domain S-box-containing protein
MDPDMPSPSLQEIKLKVESLERELSLLQSVFEVVLEPVLVLNHEQAFIKTNRKAEEMLGYPWKALQEMNFFDLIDLDDLSKVRDEFEAMKESPEVHPEVRLKTSVISQGGEKIPVELLGRLQGEGFLILLKDSRETVRFEEEWEKKKKELTEKIRERDQYARELQAMRDLYKERVREIEKIRAEAVLLSHTDDLTGIFNHRFFIQQLRLELERQKRYPSSLSLLMIDIDFFKHYNDNNGHLTGDEALKAVALLIQHAVRQTDIVARYGGEEFVAILINAERGTAIEIGERVRRSVAETPFPKEHLQPNKNLTVSVGVATFSPPLASLTDLLRAADDALYRAKKRGRNRIEG